MKTDFSEISWPNVIVITLVAACIAVLVVYTSESNNQKQTNMKKVFTKIKVIVQDNGEQGHPYVERLQETIDSICNSEHCNTGVRIIQTSSSDGRLTTTLTWDELRNIESGKKITADTTIAQSGLSTRVINVLNDMEEVTDVNVNTLLEVAQIPLHKLKVARGFGRSAVDELLSVFIAARVEMSKELGDYLQQVSDTGREF